ncbi:uncharacterized protein LOC119163080 [Rhipicephalus microplus]|uniref:uncharacterized protein LOC119163080 n=1 Tax=Rhipicephalus microplus TaxID=6941 RepID=UPI003F6BE2E0
MTFNRDSITVPRKPGQPGPGHLGSFKGKHLQQCHMCSYSTKNRTDLQRHQRIHTGERPYKCCYCGKGFIQKSNMDAHVRIHTGERPFQCHLCPWNSAWQVDLKRHMKTHKGRDGVPDSRTSDS